MNSTKQYMNSAKQYVNSEENADVRKRAIQTVP